MSVPLRCFHCAAMIGHMLSEYKRLVNEEKKSEKEAITKIEKILRRVLCNQCRAILTRSVDITDKMSVYSTAMFATADIQAIHAWHESYDKNNNNDRNVANVCT